MPFRLAMLAACGLLPWCFCLAQAPPVEPAVESHTGAASVLPCGTPEVICVGPGKEYASIQQAVDRARPGVTVQVFNGVYQGFHMKVSGEPAAPISFVAAGDRVIVDSPSPLAEHGDNIELYHCSYVIVDGFIVRNAPHSGISVVESSDIVIRNNIVGPSRMFGIFSGFSPNILVENNKTFGSMGQHGIYLSNSQVPHDNYQVRGNESWGNAWSGIQLNGDCATKSEAGASDGVIEDAIVEGNVVHDNGRKGLSIISAPGALIRNNLVFNNGLESGAGGIHLAGEPGCNLPSIDAVVVYNTVVEPRMAAVRVSDEATGGLIANNILVGRRPLLDENRDRAIAASNVERPSADGVLVNAPSGNFHLLLTSPAIGAGHPEASGNGAPTVDLDGNDRPTTGVNSAGVYEYSSVPPPDRTPPTAPTHLAASSVSGTQVTLTWLPSADPFSMTNVASGVLGYGVFRDGKRIAFTKAATYTDETLAPATKYIYTVSANDAAMNVSPASAEVTVTTPSASRSRRP